MALPYENTGTATVVAGSAAVVGQGTRWKRCRVGDTFYGRTGERNIVADIADDTHLTLLFPATTGQVAQGVAVMRTPDEAFTATQAVDVFQRLNDSTLVALAGLPAAARKGYRLGPLASAETYDLSDFALTLLDDANDIAMRTTLGLKSAALADISAKGKDLIVGADAAAMRTTLALGTLATQDAGNVSIGDGSISAGTLGVRGPNPSIGPAIITWKSANYGLIGYVGAASTDGNTSLVGTLGNVNLFPVPASSVVNLGGTSTAEVSTQAGVSVYKSGSGGSFTLYLVNAGSGGSPLVVGNISSVAGNAIAFYKGGANCGSISTTTTTTSYSTSSDYRRKPVVENLVAEFTLSADQFALLPDALRRLMALRPVRHNWLDAPNTWTHGFIAHETQPVLPHMVTGEKDAMEDVGTAVIPEHLVETGTDPDGEPVFTTVPAEHRTNVTQADAPAGSQWTKTGERPVYQEIDYSKGVADIAAGLQGLTLLVLEQHARIGLLEAALAAASTTGGSEEPPN